MFPTLFANSCPFIGSCSYGMTETSAMCAILPPEHLRLSAVGVPVPCAEIKLVDVADMGYTSKNTPPQGEVRNITHTSREGNRNASCQKLICIILGFRTSHLQIYTRGPSITKGYFKREDLTKEALTADGWFMTGDIGQWNPDGTLSIIDRKKNLVKLSGGEYIGAHILLWVQRNRRFLFLTYTNLFPLDCIHAALEQLETVYGSCNLVTKICLVSPPIWIHPVFIQ